MTPIAIYIDADACPVKQEVYRVAERHALKGTDNTDFPVLVMALYAKNEKADLSVREQKEFASYAKEAVTQWRKK